MAKTLSSQKLMQGSIAPDFYLKGVDNKMYSLSGFKSKSLLIIFMCNHCPYVKAKIKDIVNLQSKFDKENLQVVGINSNDPDYEDEGFNNMINFLKIIRLIFLI